MTSLTDQNNPGLNAGDTIGGYRVLRVAPLREINAVFYELDHGATGARHIHISNKDTENTFGVGFKTVPSDSTGVAHILEHTVLCGSRKFPVRDPFFSMLKRSLNTFMNAFTASDWTMYPFSTQNRKDFYNLMDVYLDAAFYPNIGRLNFKQEGHRLEQEEDRLVYKGVVYNEMKGAMSSPDQVMSRSLLNALYPDTTYSNNSGGDPADIPSLTHEQLVAFHRRHYHPSNAFFFTYGTLPLRDHLAVIEDRVLRNFERIDPKTDVPAQPRWQAPKTVRYPYPLAPNEAPEKKYQACVAWLTADITDSFELLALSLLNEILLGNSASPLRKALIDSGLGSALSDGTGFDADNRDTMFACGLRDVTASAAPQVEKIVFDTLNGLVRDGIDPELAEAAIHQLEFHRKEVTNTPYPYGLKLLLSFSGTWFHDGDPLSILEFDQNLQQINDERANGPFFENLIRRHFLDNPHRVRFTLAPDQEMARKEEERVAAELAAIQSGLTGTETEQIRADADALAALQEEGEDLSVLPTLELEDIPPLTLSVPAGPSRGTFPATWYEQPTSGIFYFSAAAGLGRLPEPLVHLIPFFCYALTKCGTARRDYTEISRLLDRYTGGMGLSAHARTRFDNSGKCLPFVTFSSKALVRNQGKMFELLDEFLREFSFGDMNRLKTLFLEYRAALESSVVRNGHSLAISLASRNFSVPRHLDEIWKGVHQLKTIKAITDTGEEAFRAAADDLATIGRHLFTRDNLKIALIGEADALAAAISPLDALMGGLPAGNTDGFGSPDLAPGSDIPREGWSTSTAVSFVASSFETVRMGHEDAPALSVISKMLRSLYLHREIREKGGAYGGFSLYNMEDGLFCFGSYRDPHVVSTLRVYENAGEFITSGAYTEEDVKEAILQVCADIDHPDSPGQAARKAFYRDLIGLTDEARNQYKAGLLKLSREQVMAVAEKYFGKTTRPQAVAVISDEEKLKAANEQLGADALTLHRI
ncbi:peptidase M16 [Desulfonema ishimotonii]|uniref:Peptidase M16 n=1 Tax=Desulfonema ishimotonii TaxID=45657 RepID=A0A401G2Y2_9BACT|nr:insulinase family protein [Desulfonema ishimotonii]GBC63584.1 peptidase M16 [Desulfonema ishimotonii]